MIHSHSSPKNNTNFREIRMGKIPEGLLYRGAYPVLNTTYERNYEQLVSDAHISCVLNLSDNESGLKRLANLVPWYNRLLENDCVRGLDIQFDFDLMNKFEYELFNNKLRQGFQFLITHNGPYLIHCQAGTDRTGLVVAILGALLGASIDEIVHDYLLSYYEIIVDQTKLTTGKIILEQLNTIVNRAINDENNFQSNIEKYFLEKIGLTAMELDKLTGKFYKAIPASQNRGLGIC